MSTHGVSQVLVGGAPIASTEMVRNLGAMFDQSLTMDEFVRLHISTVAISHLFETASPRSQPSHLFMLSSVVVWTTAMLF